LAKASFTKEGGRSPTSKPTVIHIPKHAEASDRAKPWHADARSLQALSLQALSLQALSLQALSLLAEPDPNPNPEDPKDQGKL